MYEALTDSLDISSLLVFEKPSKNVGLGSSNSEYNQSFEEA